MRAALKHYLRWFLSAGYRDAHDAPYLLNRYYRRHLWRQLRGRILLRRPVLYRHPSLDPTPAWTAWYENEFLPWVVRERWAWPLRREAAKRSVLFDSQYGFVGSGPDALIQVR